MWERTCCFSGHRELPIGGREQLAEKLEDTITGLIDRGIRFYGAGGARGWDTLAAQTVLRLKGRYPHIKLPSLASSLIARKLPDVISPIIAQEFSFKRRLVKFTASVFSPRLS